MKIIIKSVLITIGVLILLLICAPLLFGYKLAYIKEFICDLESMYYIWTIIGSIATVIAIFVAIRIPSKIAKQQNKIALFNQRMEIFQTFKSVYNYIDYISLLGQGIVEGKDSPIIAKEQAYYGIWKTTFYIKKQEKKQEDVQSMKSSLFNEVFLIKYLLKKQINTLMSVKYLFQVNEYKQDICKFIDSYDKFMESVFAYMLSQDPVTQKKLDELKNNNENLLKLFDLMENELNLNNKSYI